MPKDYPRSRRIAEQIQRELAGIIRLELKDPGLGTGLLTLTGVELSPDNAHAKVFFTVLGDADAIAAAEETLNHAAGFLRHELGHRMKLRVMPQLHFSYDESVERGMRLTQLIDEAVATDTSQRRK